MYEEFVAAEDFLRKAKLLDVMPPVPLEAVAGYLASNLLDICYYDPAEAPAAVKDAAHGVDEVLVYREKGATLFINRKRPITRQRFSIFHGIGHYVLPSHRGLNDLASGCVTAERSPRKPYERQADRFAAGLNMPAHRFRRLMAAMDFGMFAVLHLAKLFSASLESAAIHYVDLADVPCALVRLESALPGKGRAGSKPPYIVRYQVSNSFFPFRIQAGTTLRDFPSQMIACKRWQDRYLPEGLIRGELLSLEPAAMGNVFASLTYDAGGILALLYLGDSAPPFVVDDAGHLAALQALIQASWKGSASYDL